MGGFLLQGRDRTPPKTLYGTRRRIAVPKRWPLPLVPFSVQDAFEILGQ